MSNHRRVWCARERPYHHEFVDQLLCHTKSIFAVFGHLQLIIAPAEFDQTVSRFQSSPVLIDLVGLLPLTGDEKHRGVDLHEIVLQEACITIVCCVQHSAYFGFFGESEIRRRQTDDR